jgi:MazG family protein
MDTMANLDRMRELMRRLRAECPWDRAQDARSLIPYVLEEAYEVVAAIEADESSELPHELGDLLFQVVFQSQLGEESGRFTLDDVVCGLERKLIQRHPHVFGDAAHADSASVGLAWETHKAEQRARRYSQASELDDVPLALPALTRAGKLQKRAARVGFDWPDVDGAWRKLEEELDELRAARVTGRAADIGDELGDALFALVNVARHLGNEAETALRGANAKFERRFRAIEHALAERGLVPAAVTLEVLDSLWDAAKASEPGV